MNTIGVIIARFQSPYLHEGHRILIESVKSNHNKMIIVLGVTPVLGGKKNPLDFHTRERMIKKEYPEIVVLPLPDHPVDQKWSLSLDSLLTNNFPGARFKLYGSRDSFIPYYSGKFEVIELPETSAQRATTIRQQISDKVLDTIEFRTGIIYAYSNVYPKVYPTVDIVVFRNYRTEILLGKKEMDNKWRLLGGFSDPTDKSYEDAARRELREECGPIETTDLKYEKSFQVEDWRYKLESDKIITSLFSCDFISGDPIGSDDVGEVQWFPLRDLADMIKQNLTAVEHTLQLSLLISKYNSN